jgi:hypothetical protein
MSSGLVQTGFILGVVGLLTCVAPRAQAKEMGIDLAPMQGKKLRLDGLLREWPQTLALTEVVSGTITKGDPAAFGVMGYDVDALYVAMRIEDASFMTGQDHAELHVSFPLAGGGGSASKLCQHKAYVVKLEPGAPGKSPGRVSMGGSVVAGAQLVEAPTSSGFTFEAKIPWSAFATAATTRAGLRGSMLYVDVDGAKTATVGTSKQQGGKAPPMTIQSEYALSQDILVANGLSTRPEWEVVGNLVGDKMKERVAVYDRYLTLTGWSYREGNEFFYQDLQLQSPGDLKRVQLKDLTGDGLDELVVQREIGSDSNGQELFEVWRFDSESAAPSLLFQQEVGLFRNGGRVENDIEFTSFEGKPAIRVIATKTKVDVDTWDGVPAGGETQPVLLPWQGIASRTFVWKSGGFENVEEKAGKPLVLAPKRAGTTMWSGTGPPPGYGDTGGGASAGGKPDGSESPSSKSAPAARPPTADELSSQVYGLYLKEHASKRAEPRFDFVTDVAADPTVERVLIHGKDIVVLGKKFLQGRSYTFTTVSVENPEDIVDVTAMDLTGDGRAEVLVRGVIRAQASKKLGGDLVTRHALFIYRIMESGVTRIFAAETGRSVGKQMVLGAVRFLREGAHTGIELGPGRAIGWTKESYPFPEDRSPYGGLEPLILPWSDTKPKAYVYTEGKYVVR